MTYFGNVNPELLEIAPLTARRVLELGCGEGTFAAAYRARNPAAHYTGIEVHAPSAAIAEPRMDRLWHGNFEQMADTDIADGGPYDLIVMGDVLEHMADADHVLARLKALLADNGHLLVSVPNVAHWSALFHLINGRWPAQESGLFDRTHLRFFTLQSLSEALARAGLRLVKGKTRRFLLDSETAEKWIPPLADLAEKMGVDRQGFLNRSSTLQYVVLAEKAERPTPMRMDLRAVTFAPTLMDARTRLPASYMNSAPELFVTHVEKDLRLPTLPEQTPKIVVVQRLIPESEESWAKWLVHAAHAGGWVVVAEYDDHPDLIAAATESQAAAKWRTIAYSHAVQTSTRLLAEAFRARNPEVMPFANAVFSLAPFAGHGDGPARIFFGAANRQRFSVPVARALQTVLDKHPEVHFEVVHDRAFFEALPTSAKTFHPTLPYDDYLAVMDRCDIALLPLEGHEAEKYKSDIKYVEAASRGLAVIASPAVYAETVHDGKTGLIAQSLSDWAPAVDRLVGDSALRRTLARAAWEDVRDHRMFAYQVNARRDWYTDLWRRRAELQASLIERLPLLGQLLGR